MLRLRSIPPERDPDDPRVVRLRPSPGFGDHLMVSAVIEGLKADHPDLRVRLAVSHPEIFEHNPHVESAIRIRELERVDPERLGKYIRLKPRQPEERRVQLEGHLIDDLYSRLPYAVRNRVRFPRLYLTERELTFRQARLERLERPRIAIVPYGKGAVRLPNKVYPADQWAELTALLVSNYPSVLQLGTRKEGDRLPGTIDCRDLGYRQTGALLCRCDLLVTHVSGLMHLAAAVGTPAVVIYGAAEHPAISGYPTNRNLYTPIECGPCWMEEPCSHHSCMRGLAAGTVLEEVRSELAARRQDAHS